MDGVFIMPDASGWIRDLVNNESSAIDARFRFDGGAGRTRPSAGRRSHSNRRTNGGKTETSGAGDIVAPIRGVVVHVALAGMRLAPGIFVRAVVLNLSKIGRTRVHRG